MNKCSIALFPVKTSSTRLIRNVQQMSENGSMLPHYKHTNFNNNNYFYLYLSQRANISKFENDQTDTSLPICQSCGSHIDESGCKGVMGGGGGTS